MKKLNKGITLVSLIITIVIILILTSVVVTNTYTGSDYKRYKNMCSDVKLLEDKILIYYNKYGKIPTIELTAEELASITAGLESIVDKTKLEKVDTSKLSGITLTYGDEEDIFLINKDTFEVYYLNGIEYEGVTYYTE